MACDRCGGPIDEPQAVSLYADLCSGCTASLRAEHAAYARRERRVPRFPAATAVTNTVEGRELRDQATRDLRPDWKQDQAETTRLQPQPKKEITTVITRDTAHRIAKRVFGLVDSEKVADIIMQEINRALGHTVPHYELRHANLARQAEWDAGAQITPTYRCTELAGEIGEACNIVKKLERERLGIRGSRSTVTALGEELADGVICLDLLAMDYGIDLLGHEVPKKFNATSEANGLKTRMLARF